MNNNRLDRLRIASPCPTSWEQMHGNDRVRFCDLCSLHVYNFAELTQREAESLVAKTEGRICARLYRRSDDTVITKDCPVGLRAIRRRIARLAGAAFATLLSLGSLAMGQKPLAKGEGCKQQVKITRTLKKVPSEDGVVSGTVLDHYGAVVVGAKVALLDLASMKVREVESGSDGQFLFSGIAPGSFELAVKSPGFKHLLEKDLKIVAMETISLEVTLLVQEASIGLVGLPMPSLIDTSMPGTTIISGDLIRKLPIP